MYIFCPYPGSKDCFFHFIVKKEKKLEYYGSFSFEVMKDVMEFFNILCIIIFIHEKIKDHIKNI